jgi:hypothetical protein
MGSLQAWQAGQKSFVSHRKTSFDGRSSHLYFPINWGLLFLINEGNDKMSFKKKKKIIVFEGILIDYRVRN